MPPSAEFIVQFDLAPHSRLTISSEQMANGLETICGMAFERAMQKHLFGGNHQKMGGGEIWSIEEKGEMQTNGTNENNKIGAGAVDGQQQPTAPAFRVRIVGINPGSTIRPFARLQFVVFLHHHDEDRPIPAQAIVRDISLISFAELSAILRIPVLRIGALAQMEMADQQAQWWHIALIATGGILVIGCGWAILFCWMNLCVRRVKMVGEQMARNENGTTPKQIEEGMKKRKKKKGQEEDEVEKNLREGEGEQNLIKRIGGRKLLMRPKGSRKWRRKSRQMTKRTTMMATMEVANVAKATKRLSTGGVEKEDNYGFRMAYRLRNWWPFVELWRKEQQEMEASDGQNEKKKEATNEQQQKQNDWQQKSDETNGKMAASAIIGPSLPLALIPSESPYPPNNPYWTADQLERIFHVSKMPSTHSHPRPAPPTEYGEIRIGPIDEPI